MKNAGYMEKQSRTADRVKVKTLISCWLFACLSLVGALHAAERPHVVILHGEPEYGSERTMPAFAREIESRLGARATLLQSNRSEQGDLPSLDALDDADLLVLFIRFRMATGTQFERLKAWFDSGKPAIAFRTTSHGFWENKGWFVPFFGGHYKSHAPNRPGTSVIVPSALGDHPLVRGVERHFHAGYGGTYNAQPLSEFVTPILLGKTLELPSEPVAWTAAYRPGQRLFYTSLGAEDNFEQSSFRNLILNAVVWGLERTVPAGGVLGQSVVSDSSSSNQVPSPPDSSSSGESLLMAQGDLSLWQHWDPSVAPRAIGIDTRADTSSGGPVFTEARWQREGASVIARPGFGDIVTKESFGDGTFRVDFLIPRSIRDLPQKFRGNSGVFIDGKWEIQISDSYGVPGLDDQYTCGAIFGVAAPSENACLAPGVWQSMEVEVQHRNGGAVLSVWLNGKQIHDQVAVSEPTLYGFSVGNDEDEDERDESVRVIVFNKDSSSKADFGGDFVCSVRFRTDEDGPIFGKARPFEEYRKNDKSLYVSEGKLHFDVGSVRALSSVVRVDDDEWHNAIVRSQRGRLSLILDGRKRASVGSVHTPDSEGSRLLLGFVSSDYPESDEYEALQWQGEIGSFQFFAGSVPAKQPAAVRGQARTLVWEPREHVDLIEGKAARDIDFGKGFTAMVRFRGEESGPLLAKAPESGAWAPDGKVLFVEGSRVVFDIGWLGALASGDVEVDDGEWHVAAVTHDRGKARLFVDGKLVDEAGEFARPDIHSHVVKVGACSTDFPEGTPNGYGGNISHVGFLSRAMSPKEVLGAKPSSMDGKGWRFWREYLDEKPRDYRVVPLSVDEDDDEQEEAESEDLVEDGVGPLRLQADSAAVRFANVSVEPLGDIDHASIIRSWDGDTLLRGQRVYDAICITCHGNLEKEGTLPTSRKFWEAEFKNGKDPYRLFKTLETGYEQMPAFPFLTVQQRYDVIHYLREALVKPTNQNQYFEVTDTYLESLPKGKSVTGKMTEEMLDYAKGPKYLRMDFGPMLDWTYQVAPDNIAYKAIAIRLDEGQGGVSKGRAWQVYDHDTMRVAAAWSGDEFIDWKGIALDQSHGTHASIVGDVAFVNPVGPGWAHPVTGSWDDPRFLGRDGKPYGPVPRDWVQFRGQYVFENKVVVHYTVGDSTVMELPGMELSDSNVVYSRTLNIGKSSRDLSLRLAPESVAAALVGTAEARIETSNGFNVLRIPANATPLNLKVLVGSVDESKMAFQAMVSAPVEDLGKYLKGGETRYPEIVETQGENGGTDRAFEVDEITYPVENPWHSWMRLGGFDFLPGGKRAAVATWLGDVWLVDGIDGRLGTHRWKRICTGLFQPLGVKVVDGVIYVTCRDQIARLHDYNGDEEIDYIESFNSDHQVTEHFHEFAMGLQTDPEGNFYYAKSARHAKPALVPHHGTLLKVSSDGEHTEILAAGFRAANGVCLNPDGSFIVTDQEGHWNPKNRINYVRKGGFYGNMMGYHDVVDESDEAMEQPLCWITNAFDRSPGELLWVPENAGWGPLNGQLMNMSYGTGQVFLVPHEIVNGQAQGGMVSLGLEFPTGTMRGRFHETNGQLYSTGMFAWAGNQHQDGGFYRIRYTEKPAHQLTGLRALRRGVELTFTDPLDSRSARDIANYEIKIWDLKRTKNYGSKHYNERPLEIDSVELSNDRKSIFLKIPEIAPTWSMEIKMDLQGENGESVERVIHNTIHHLQDTAIF
jgi:mono/diheme cytochrome c family protein/type 1 glutamine amidotransferase